MEEGRTCHECIYYGPYSQNPEVSDYWCFRHDMRVIGKTPECDNYKRRDGGELSVNAPYLGYMKREEDRKLEEKKRQEDADRKHKEIRRTQKIIAAAMVLTVVMGFWGVLIQNNTQEIVKETQKITAESSIPNKASLIIYSEVELDKLTFDRAHLADSTRNSADIDIKIQNSGRVDSGTLNIWWNMTTSNSSFNIWPSHENPTNIEGGKRKLVQMNIMCFECPSYYADHKDEIRNKNLTNLVPKGELELELIVKCSQCTPEQQIHTKKFKICLYDDPKECESFTGIR